MVSAWMSGLEARHLANLTLPETARALRALSSNYVERRERLGRRTAFDSAGKRAAYALYYNPLHFLTVTAIVRGLGLAATPVRHVLDVGCGAGAAGAAWASAMTPPARVTGIDEHPWAIEEAASTYRAFGLDARARRGNLALATVPRDADAVVAAWVLNELDEVTRGRMRSLFVAAAQRGSRVLIVEPIATRVSPWWPEWVDAFTPLGARADEWRVPLDAPPIVRRLGAAAGLGTDTAAARSLCVAPPRRFSG